MRTRGIMWLSLLIVGGTLTVHHLSAAGAPGVEGVDAAWAAAMKANDLEAVIACYAPDAVAWFSGQRELKGTAAIRGDYAELFRVYHVKDAAVFDAHYQVWGDLAVGWGKYTLSTEAKSGGAVNVSQGRFTEVAARRDGRWVYLVDHASTEPRQ
jgi:uncharacterized protein (TIGR02246 family)